MVERHATTGTCGNRGTVGGVVVIKTLVTKRELEVLISQPGMSDSMKKYWINNTTLYHTPDQFALIMNLNSRLVNCNWTANK